jgi:hypothetical protein
MSLSPQRKRENLLREVDRHGPTLTSQPGCLKLPIYLGSRTLSMT